MTFPDVSWDTYGCTITLTVVGASHAAIRVDLHLLEDFGRVFPDVEQYLDGGGRAVENTASVVRDINSLESEVEAGLSILPCFDSLGNDGQAGHVANLIYGLDGECS